jgi:hypothetical protein
MDGVPQGQGGGAICVDQGFVGSLQILHALPRAWDLLEGEILDAARGTPEFGAKES